MPEGCGVLDEEFLMGISSARNRLGIGIGLRDVDVFRWDVRRSPSSYRMALRETATAVAHVLVIAVLGIGYPP